MLVLIREKAVHTFVAGETTGTMSWDLDNPETGAKNGRRVGFGVDKTDMMLRSSSSGSESVW